MIKIAMTKGRIEKNMEKMLLGMGYDISPIVNKDRKLLVDLGEDFQIVFVKSVDVVNLVNSGAVDIGIVGSDTIFENPSEKYSQLVDLESGKCYFALCGFPSYMDLPKSAVKRIATKYPNITKKFFEKKQEEIEIVKLQGSVELGPIIGISDAIVDIVETGETLRANGLMVIEPVGAVSTRLIGNNDRIREKEEEIGKFIEQIQEYKQQIKVKCEAPQNR
ncbi:MAG: ATP phosphoribosyltransferase [Clostridia bacterium]|nr:ATP phosphoribosyltransferase [Clostridia bacterium]